MTIRYEADLHQIKCSISFEDLIFFKEIQRKFHFWNLPLCWKTTLFIVFFGEYKSSGQYVKDWLILGLCNVGILAAWDGCLPTQGAGGGAIFWKCCLSTRIQFFLHEQEVLLRVQETSYVPHTGPQLDFLSDGRLTCGIPFHPKEPLRNPWQPTQWPSMLTTGPLTAHSELNANFCWKKVYWNWSEIFVTSKHIH